MKVLATANILVVGIECLEIFDRMPVTAKEVQTGIEAVSSLKYEEFNAVISRWNLADMPNGRFIKGLRLIKPDLPVVAVIDADDPMQEISARACGVKAVVSNSSLTLLQNTLAGLLRITAMEKTTAVTAL